MATEQKDSKLKLRIFSIGKRKLKVDEFASIVSANNAFLELNEAAMEQLKQDSSKPLPQMPITLNNEKFDTASPLSFAQSRAVMLMRVQSFFQNRSCVRPGVVQFLVDLLNAYITPVLPSSSSNSEVEVDQIILAALASCFDPASSMECERGSAIGTRVPLAIALKDAGITPPVPLNSFERRRFLLGVLPSQALHILATAQLRNLIRVADAVSGLSCEAAMVFTEPFQQAHYDVARPYVTAVEVASIMRWMLDGSSNVNKLKERASNHRAFRYIPAVQAVLRDAAQMAYNTARIDLNSSEAAGHKNDWQHDPSLPLNQLDATARSLYHALVEAVTASIARSRNVLSSINTIGPIAASFAAASTSASSTSTSTSVTSPEGSTVVPTSATAPTSSPTAILDAFSNELQVISSEVASRSSHTSLTSAPNAVFALAALAADYQAALQLEGAIALQVIGARDALALAASEAAIVKKIIAEQKRAQMLAEKAAATAAATAAAGGADGATPDAAVAGKAAKPAKKEKEKTKEELEEEKEKRVPKGIILGLGSRVVRKLLTQDTQAYPIYGLDNAASSADVAAALARLRTVLTPDREDIISQLTAATTVSNVTEMPKLPKGTRDAGPELMAIRERAFGIIMDVFKKHGAVGIDTPVFERKDTLMGKYGEDAKLIYDLADQGGEVLSLRYDLTVPFARYCATTGTTNIKRYHIAKVYRRDNPAMKSGRFREFFQCDYDCAGIYPSMIPDAEVLKIMSDILSKLNLGGFVIKLNHRKLLDAIMAIAGVPADKFRPICSAIDKLDKEPWSAVREEMVFEKGLSEAAADRIEGFVTRPPGKPRDMLAALLEDEDLKKSVPAQEALADMGVLFSYLEALEGIANISFDLSLARGLDYYTGIIFEAVLTGGPRMGSIGAGGRYDNLVGMFAGKQVPAVGMSIGIERILAIMEEREKNKGAIRTTNTDVFVASMGQHLLTERMKICSELWKAGVGAEFLYIENPSQRKQAEHIFDNAIPFGVWIGEDEMKRDVVMVKEYKAKKEEGAGFIEVSRSKLVEVLKPMIRNRATADEIEEAERLDNSSFSSAQGSPIAASTSISTSISTSSATTAESS